jgi:hypothetical protein
MNQSSIVLIAGLLALCACSNPEAEGRFNEYGDRTADRRGTADAGDMGTPEGARIDFSGTYFLALEVAGVGVGKPIYIQTDVTVDLDANTIMMVLQPLKSDIDLDTSAARPDMRTPVGDSITVEGIPFEEDGTFVADLGVISVDGQANPITGGEIEASMVLHGIVARADLFCGAVTGMATKPIPLDLAGSTFGTVKSDDFLTVEPAVRCPENVGNNGNNGDMDAGMDVPGDTGDMDAGEGDAGDVGPEPRVRCVDGLAGSYLLTFQSDRQDTPSTVKFIIESSEEGDVCYTGSVESIPDEGEDVVDLGEVEYVREIDGVLTFYYNFIIPPGAILENGGQAKNTLTADRWAAHGSCGGLVIDPYDPVALSSSGGYAMLREGEEGYTVGGPGCEHITATDECPWIGLAGEYHLQFNTTAGVTNVFLNLEEEPLTCLGGTIVSKLNEGEVIARLQGASENPDAEGQVFLNFRNFMIAPGANNLLPGGGTSDMMFYSTSFQDGLCGNLTAALFEPSALTSMGTFNTSPASGDEPGSPACE